MILSTTSHSVSLNLVAAGTIAVYASYTDHTDLGATDGIASLNATSGTTTIIAAPAASTQRQIRTIFCKNTGTATSQVTIYFNDGSTREVTPKVSLAPGEMMQYTEPNGWTVLLANGVVKTQSSNVQNPGSPFNFYKVGTAPEAAGQRYSTLKDSGAPGAFAVGTPGLSGRTITSLTEGGRIPIPDAASGASEIIAHSVSASVACAIETYDLMWINTGLVVTTLTAQTVNSIALPARDLEGSSLGKGVVAAILVTAATTNAAAIANTTMSYTNSAGVPGRTATITSFPATAVIGTLVLFRLQAGDDGIQSIQTVTLGTSYGGGSISLVLMRPLLFENCSLAHAGNFSLKNYSVKIFNGTYLAIVQVAAATTATVFQGFYNVRAIL